MKAIIFDMDGVLIDSEPLWKIAEIEAFAKVGLDLKTTDCEATVGMRIDQVVEMWHKRVGWTNKTVKEVTNDVVDIVVREIKKTGTALPGVIETLKQTVDSGYRIGLASSSYNRIIDAVVDQLDIRRYFDILYSAEDEPHGKPHPGVFITCASYLGVRPEECIVIEDSFNGIIAAKAARMKVIAIPELSHQKDPRINFADHVLKSMEEINIQEINNYFA